MSSTIQITFGELQQLPIDNVISKCPNPESALKICAKSCAPPTDIYSVWVNKLFKAYITTKCSTSECKSIVDYLSITFKKFVSDYKNGIKELLKHLCNLTKLAKDVVVQEASNIFNTWLVETLELLKWLTTISDALGVAVFKLMLILVFDIFKTFLRTLKSCQLNDLEVLQQQLHSLIKNYVSYIKIQTQKDFFDMTEVLHALCEVGVLVSSHEIKIALETWRLVAKLTACYSTWFGSLNGDNSNALQMDWIDKPLGSVFEELLKLMKYILQEDILRNDNFLKLILFYIQHLRFMANYDHNQTFANVQIFFEIYVLNKHFLQLNIKHPLVHSINEELMELFAKIYYRKNVDPLVLQHCCPDNCAKNCDLILDYITLCVKYHKERPPFIKHNIQIFIKLFDRVCTQGKQGYNTALECFACIAILDTTYSLHKHLSELIFHPDNLTLAFASSDVLKIYYEYSLKHFGWDFCLPFLKFWLNCLKKLSAWTFSLENWLIQYILRDMRKVVPKDLWQQLVKDADAVSNRAVNCAELFHLNVNCNLNNLVLDIRKHFTELHQLTIQTTAYRDLIWKMRILYHHPEFIDNTLMSQLHEIIVKLFQHCPHDEIRIFQLFFDISFKLICSKEEWKKYHISTTELLSNYEEKAFKICSVHMVEFLLSHRMNGTFKLLCNLPVTTYQIVREVINCDVGTFREPFKSNKQSHIVKNDHKRIRLSENVVALNTQQLLNEMLQQSTHLLNIKQNLQTCDDGLIQSVITNLKKCLEK